VPKEKTPEGPNSGGNPNDGAMTTAATLAMLLTVDFGTPSYKFTVNICTSLIF
jgi:hypothetical protein